MDIKSFKSSEVKVKTGEFISAAFNDGIVHINHRDRGTLIVLTHRQLEKMMQDERSSGIKYGALLKSKQD